MSLLAGLRDGLLMEVLNRRGETRLDRDATSRTSLLLILL
jgi:hypothetical protein